MVSRKIRRSFGFVVVILMVLCLLLSACSASDPLPESLFTKDIFPGTTSLYNIGSPALTYLNGYFDNLFVGGVPVVPGGGGDVTGPAGATDNAVPKYDGVTGKIIQDTGVTINDFDTVACPAITTQNILATGLVQADRFAGDIEGGCLDVLQVSNLNIALNDTLDLAFLFIPDLIVIDYTGRCEHDTTLDAGHTTGHSVITITGVDAMTCNTNYTSLVNNSGAFGSHIGQNDAVNSVVVYGGNDGVDDGYFYGVGGWTTATRTLQLTFSTVANTNTATNYIEILAIAYR